MFKPLPDPDPNEAYDVIPAPAHYRMPPGWWTVTCNGIPVMHFSPGKRDLAERYATDPEYRQSLVTQKIWEKNAR
jgi:hypothetical protein